MQATLERLRQRREGEDDNEGGFTLIELLIVIVILGILAAIVVFAVQSLSGSSAQAACKADYKTVESAAEAYKAQEGSYPANDAALTSKATDGNGPWLKDTPSNGTHYQIVVAGPDANGNLVENVDNFATPAAPIAGGCSGVS